MSLSLLSSYKYLETFPNSLKFISLFKKAGAAPSKGKAAYVHKNREEVRKELAAVFGEDKIEDDKEGEEDIKADERFGTASMVGGGLKEEEKEEEKEEKKEVV